MLIFFVLVILFFLVLLLVLDCFYFGNSIFQYLYIYMSSNFIEFSQYKLIIIKLIYFNS